MQEDYSLNGGVQSWAEQEESTKHHENMYDGVDRAKRGRPEASTVEIPVGKGPVNESEETLQDQKKTKVSHLAPEKTPEKKGTHVESCSE